MGHAAYRPESSRRPLSNGIKFARIGVRTRGVMAPGSRGVGAVFVHFSDEDSGQTGDAIGEPRVPRRSWSHYLSNAPGLADQLVASRKDSAREGGSPDVGFRRSWYRRKACVAYFCKVPDLRKSELGLVRYGSANRGHRSVFGPARGSTCCESGRLCAQAWQRRWENSGTFSKALFRRPVFTRVVDDVSSWYRRKAGATYFPKVQALHRGELGFARYDLANGGRRNVPYAKGFGHNSLVSRPFLARKVSNRSSSSCSSEWSMSGQFDSAFGLVNGPGQTLVKLGQPWSNLVENSPNSGKCIPEYILRASSDHAGSVWVVPSLRADIPRKSRGNEDGVTQGLRLALALGHHGMSPLHGGVAELIAALLEALASFWDPTHCCFSIGEVDLIPTMEDAFPAELARDFIAGKKEWKKFRINAFKIAFAGIFLFPTSAGRIDLGVIPIEYSARAGLSSLPYCARPCGLYLTCRRQGEGVPDVLHTAPSALVLQSPAAFLTASRLLIILRDIRLLGGRQRGCPGLIVLLFDGVPLPGVWGCTGYYPSLALRQFSGVQYPPRLGDLDAVTFDYIPGEDMWRLLFRIEDIWGGRLSEMVLIEEGSRPEIALLPLWTLSSGERGGLPFLLLRPTVRPGAPYSFDISLSSGISLHWASEREASAARVESLRSTLHHNSVAVANLRRDLVAQRGNVSTLRTMNEFIREQLEISEDAKEQLEETLAEAREQLETEQAERTRVQDELDSLRSYTQALVDPATGRPQDIVALRRALDASEEALTSARTSMGVMRVQISVLQGDNGGLCRLSWTWCMMLLSPMLLGSIRRVSLWSLLFTRLTR
uniref:Uncharacterized protein n=1 Tax=Fagus sylvatica TaxID=28930 RepID=A0A2N9G767_FAGSY